MHGRFQTQSSLVDAKQDDVHRSPREVNGHSATTVPVAHEDGGAGDDHDSRERGRLSRGTGGVSKERAATARGVTLSLDGVGLQDETLCRVGVHQGCRAALGKIFMSFHVISYIPSRPIPSRSVTSRPVTSYPSFHSIQFTTERFRPGVHIEIFINAQGVTIVFICRQLSEENIKLLDPAVQVLVTSFFLRSDVTQVVHKLLRHCTLIPPELQAQMYEDGDDESCGKTSPREGICSRLGWSGEEHLSAWSGVNRVMMGDREGSAKDDAVVPLERLLLQGNFITVRIGKSGAVRLAIHYKWVLVP